MVLPRFTREGILPDGVYSMTIEQLRSSFLVTGEGAHRRNWDKAKRGKLVRNLEVLVRQLWDAGIQNVYVDGSFVQQTDRPADIDVYFECDRHDVESGDLERRLNTMGPFAGWSWDHYLWIPNSDGELKSEAWHKYGVDCWPEYPGCLSGGYDKLLGRQLSISELFRRVKGKRRTMTKGIIHLLPERSGEHCEATQNDPK